MLDTGAELAAANGLRGLELRARVLRLGTTPESMPGAMTEAEMLAETNAALAELEELGDSRGIAAALVTRAEMETALGHAGAGVAAAQRAIRIAQAADEDVVWAVRTVLRAVVASPMSISDAEAFVAGLIDELGVRPTVRLELTEGQAILATLRGRDEAWRLLESAQEMERDLGRSDAFHLVTTRARMHLLAGDYDAARRALPGIVADLERHDALSNAAVVRSWLALAEVRSGDLASARATATAALAGTAYGGRYEAGARANLALAEVHLGERDAEAAVAAARAGHAIAEAGDWMLLRADARLVLARALDASGDAAAAAAEAQRALDLYRAKGHPAATAVADAFLRTLAVAPG